MIEDSLFRIISLAILMIVTGIGWYKIKLEKLKNEKEDHKKIKEEAKNEGIKFSVVLGVIYMVVILGISG
ncbi:hypothetical protein [Halanaerobium hydrogeniformans]|uniref:Uncharacterized protein n=1 Tax=Halanaerobium hydrogeniformans TaxID=656519 RepID=E4RN41_HALHG|nr:hypothetical protein [Halanaerobium hydrogeniformans]ADQ14258.1 hypothetical protein Halsa_0811 [Halanaerobium hydrogeniformans]